MQLRWAQPELPKPMVFHQKAAVLFLLTVITSAEVLSSI